MQSPTQYRDTCDQRRPAAPGRVFRAQHEGLISESQALPRQLEAYLHKSLGSFHSRGVWVESGWRSFQRGSFAKRISRLAQDISETPATGCPSL